MPAEDVSDLRDVFDAINKLCETMKSSDYSDETSDDAPPEMVVRSVEILTAEDWDALSSCETNCDAKEFVSAEDISIQKSESHMWKELQPSVASSEVSKEAQERWSDTQTSPPSSEVSVRESYRADVWSDCPVSPPEDVETITSDTEPAAQCEPISDVYYTASSEVSLVSDTDDKAQITDKEGKCVVWGHVAAMRERFENMTRANTPCPDLMRSASPSLDVFRNITPSPERLG